MTEEQLRDKVNKGVIEGYTGIWRTMAKLGIYPYLQNIQASRSIEFISRWGTKWKEY